MFCVYIIYSEKLDRFYVGTADDFKKRFAEHNSGQYEEAFTKKGIPWKEFLIIENLKSSQAYEIERHIKQMKSKKYIKDLNKYPELIEKLKERYK